MLNRRLLRIKVMQALYALKQSEISNYHNALGFIDESFAPDLNANEKQDTEKLENYRKEATTLFEERYKSGDLSSATQNNEILSVVDKSITQLNNHNKKDLKHFFRLLQSDLDNVYDEYISVLCLILNIGDFASEYEEGKKGRYIKSDDIISGNKFFKNELVEILRNDTSLEKERAKRNIGWSSELVKKFYKDILLKDETFNSYLKENTHSFESDKKVVLYISKSLIFKDKITCEYFEEKDLNWGENKSIVSGLVSKTLKEIPYGAKEVKLLELSPNWDEDKMFYNELFDKTISIEDRLEEIIGSKAKNWDLERIAAIDMIILKMALSEMLGFPSIPVKVTINEYIELSKVYSTPKSKKFVNGLLDNLASELTNSGEIRKSGRGLIDNK
ncbi:MAG: transcription antitermination factor NusB [Cytophagaceae bacterium]